MGILRYGKHDLAYRVLSGLPHAVFAVSEQVRRFSIEHDRIDASRVHTIYNSLDPEQWAPVRRARSEACQIKAVGNIRRVKGHDVLLQATASILPSHPEAFFTIAGAVLDPAYMKELETFASTHRVAEHVRFAGPVQDVQKFLGTADIFVMPSRNEGFSNAIVEAMASGLPVVATDVGGNAEAVVHGVTGLIVPSDDPAALASALKDLVVDPDLRARMGSAARARVEETFADGVVLEKLMRQYKAILPDLRFASSVSPVGNCLP
jgi:glycosyltransferase involved in cell wall biosynthesis